MARDSPFGKPRATFLSKHKAWSGDVWGSWGEGGWFFCWGWVLLGEGLGFSVREGLSSELALMAPEAPDDSAEACGQKNEWDGFANCEKGGIELTLIVGR